MRGSVRETLEKASERSDLIGDEFTRAEVLRQAITSALTQLDALERDREAKHTTWCRSNELDLCTGCSVKKGWDRNGVTGEPTSCHDEVPHEWLPKPCNCGPNDRRRGDRRILGKQGEGE